MASLDPAYLLWLEQVVTKAWPSISNGAFARDQCNFYFSIFINDDTTINGNTTINDDTTINIQASRWSYISSVDTYGPLLEHPGLLFSQNWISKGGPWCDAYHVSINN